MVEAKGRVGAPSDNREIAARTVAEEKKNKQGKNSGRKSSSKIPPLPQPNDLTAKQAQLWRMLHDTSDKGGMGGAMQMSVRWIREHLTGFQLGHLEPKHDYDRFIYLVASIDSASALAAQGVGDHRKALTDAISQEAIDHTKHEATHGISVEYDERDIAKVEALRSRSNGPNDSRRPTVTQSDNPPRNPSSKKPPHKKP